MYEQKGSMGGGIMAALRGAAAGAPAAVVTDVGLQMGPAPSWSNLTRELVRSSVGAGLTLGLLAAGVPEAYAIGPAVVNIGVSAVQASRINDLAGKLRGAYAPH